MVAIAVYALPTLARITRASALGAMSGDHVLAARAAGATGAWIVRRHVLPLCLSPLVAQATLMLGKAVLMASGLSFLGLGVPPPDAEWGAMLSRGRDLIRSSPLGAMAPGLAITIVVLSFSMAGDGLRDALDPKA
jgi:peptide/nickel transport system permease protein